MNPSGKQGSLGVGWESPKDHDPTRGARRWQGRDTGRDAQPPQLGGCVNRFTGVVPHGPWASLAGGARRCHFPEEGAVCPAGLAADAKAALH